MVQTACPSVRRIAYNAQRFHLKREGAEVLKASNGEGFRSPRNDQP